MKRNEKVGDDCQSRKAALIDIFMVCSGVAPPSSMREQIFNYIYIKSRDQETKFKQPHTPWSIYYI